MLIRTLICSILASLALAAPAAAAEKDGTTNQVQINKPDTTSEVDIPIKAELFIGAQGPKSCRGSPMVELNLPKPGALHTSPVCYDFPEPASCAIFMAGKEDGCEAKLFIEHGCKTFVNLAVFLPEERAVGGFFRSMSVRCGVEAVEPPPLRLPGMRQQQPVHERA